MAYVRLLLVVAFLAEVSARSQVMQKRSFARTADSLLRSASFDSSTSSDLSESRLRGNAVSKFYAASSFEAPGEEVPEGIDVDKGYHLRAGKSEYVNLFEVENLDDPDLADDTMSSQPPAVCPDLPLTQAGSRVNTFAGRMYFSLKAVVQQYAQLGL
jgi:hypothetical protein